LLIIERDEAFYPMRETIIRGEPRCALSVSVVIVSPAPHN